MKYVLVNYEEGDDPKFITKRDNYSYSLDYAKTFPTTTKAYQYKNQHNIKDFEIDVYAKVSDS